MSKISELIKEKCPNGVKYELLKNICLFKRGQSITIKSLREGTYPVVAGGQKPAAYCSEFNRDYECITISSSGAYAGFVSYWNEKILCTDSFSITSKDKDILINKFIFYFLKSKQETIYSKKKGAGIPHVHISDIDALKIPIPPIEVQEEIVRILDKFSELEAELEAELETELEARKKQYEFWHKRLLNNNNNKAEHKKIANIFNRLKGTSITARKMKEIEEQNGSIRIFAGGKTLVNTSEKNIPVKDIIRVPSVIVQSRGLIDFIYYDKPFTFKNEMWAYTCDNPITTKYLYYYLKANVNYFRKIGEQMGSMPQISLPITENFEISLSPLEEQKRIVNILDKFDKLINNISEGIPAEIEARKKQYEYYRNKLLSFEELKDEKESI